MALVVGTCNPPLSVGRHVCSAKFPNFIVLKGNFRTSILIQNVESKAFLLAAT